MRLFEIDNHRQKHFVGTCQNSFDDGECIVSQLPWSTVSDFAVDEENAINISILDFQKMVDIPSELKSSLQGHRLIFQKTEDNSVFMIYDDNTDIHYFFV